ncbi:hypothetical protein EIN_252320 [Entamoeba invadens IP1]|uniref:DNA replication complex GINS protein SLD5 n=1 Tax=Entamoeba invadens IP1 TaxID=370355 RepID=A0A0A1UEX7_ENTIV|nr:hypothetical protein EIN_252320 [Entamoeba invadens IP1]ELP95018.1 hypothetical protein EIN_252320 [Entamoeba invadens IP1]|eukprot:XP_004261789.1 hypothetical protein EIN_252320 [Entamoeba invadens IP1]
MTTQTQSDEVADFPRFLRTIQNEINSPVIQLYDKHIVSKYKQVILNQEQVVEGLMDQNVINGTLLMQVNLVKQEITRINYYITLYLKVRLSKVLQMARMGSNDTAKLTPEENTVFLAYSTIRNDYMTASGLTIQEKKPVNLEIKRNSSYVFVKILSPISNFKISPDDEEGFYLEKNAIYLFPYSSVAEFVNSDYLELI